MFYCEKCRIENEWPESMVFSTGKCEMCDIIGECYDKPSSHLPRKEVKEPTVYDILAEHLELKETNIPNKWVNEYNEYFMLTKFGFRRIISGRQTFNPEEVLDMLETLSAELHANGTLSQDIPKWFENEIKRRK
jgi:hypothetical protein